MGAALALAFRAPRVFWSSPKVLAVGVGGAGNGSPEKSDQDKGVVELYSRPAGMHSFGSGSLHLRGLSPLQSDQRQIVAGSGDLGVRDAPEFFGVDDAVADLLGRFWR